MNLPMSFFSLKREPSLSLVCDLRDATVSIAAVALTPKGKPELVLCQTTPLSLPEPVDSVAYIESVIQTLDSSIVNLRKSLIKTGDSRKVEHAYFFLGSPWVVSQSKLLKVVRDKSFEVNNTFLSRIISREESFVLHHLSQVANDTELVICEEKIISTKLNGYPVENIFGKRVRDFEAELFVSFVPKMLIGRLQQLAQKETHHDDLIHASLLALYTFLHESSFRKNDAVCIDIGDAITEVCIARNGAISGIVSFPFGRRQIISEAAKAAGISEQIFTSHIGTARDGHTEAVDSQTLAAVESALSSWLTIFGESVSQMMSPVTAPRDALFIRHDSFDDTLVDILMHRQPIELFNIPLRVSTINDHSIDGEIVNAKAFPDQFGIKTNILFLARLTASK